MFLIVSLFWGLWERVGYFGGGGGWGGVLVVRQPDESVAYTRMHTIYTYEHMYTSTPSCLLDGALQAGDGALVLVVLRVRHPCVHCVYNCV